MCKIKYLQCSRSQTRFIRWSKKITHSRLRRRQGPGRPMNNILVHRSNSSAPSLSLQPLKGNQPKWMSRRTRLPLIIGTQRMHTVQCLRTLHAMKACASTVHLTICAVREACGTKLKQTFTSFVQIDRKQALFLYIVRSYTMRVIVCSRRSGNREQWEKRQQKTLGEASCDYPFSHCFSLFPDWQNVWFRQGDFGNIPSLVNVLGQNTLNSPKVYNFPVI